MFDRDKIETRIRNAQGLVDKLIQYGSEYKLVHGAGFTDELLGGHTAQLEQLFNEVVKPVTGKHFTDVGYTYSVKCYREDGKAVVKVYQPRLVLKQGTAQLQWGDVSVRLSDLAQSESLYIQPQVVRGDKRNSYSIVLGTESGDVALPLYPKDGCAPTTAQLAKAITSGEGWVEIMSPPFPTDVKKLVSATEPMFSFIMNGYRVAAKSGKTKTGQSYSFDEMVLESNTGELYSTKVNRSRNSQDLAYWGEQCSTTNPIQVTVCYEGIGEYNGAKYNQWGVTCRPVNQPSSTLADLFDLGDPMESDEDVSHYTL